VVLSIDVGSDECSTQISQAAGPNVKELMQPHKDTVFAPNESGVDILRCYHTESEKRRFDVNLQYN
jgi:hypothetical protein